MTTIEITDIADVRDGDIVTLRWEREAGVTVTVEGPAQDSRVSGYIVTDARFISATREVPEWEPGTVYEITTPDGDTGKAWCVRHTPDDTSTGFVDEDCTIWQAGELTSIKPLPDDAEALRRDVVKYKEAARKYQREHDKECAEVERLRAARTVPTREQAVAAIEKRLSWASIHWGVEHLHPDALPEIAGAVLGVVERGGTS